MLAKLISKSIILMIALFVLAGSLGVPHVGMQMGPDGSMSDCPFMPGVSICDMSLFDMLSASQGLFGDVSLGQDFTLLVLLISGFFVLGTLLRWFSPPNHILRYRLRYRVESFLYNFLREAFSSGLLNPKLF